MSEELDATDHLLLAELQADGRKTLAELGRTAGMSSPAVAERIRRLERLGVILGYTARVDPAKLGLSVLAFVRLASFGADHRDGAMRGLLEIPEVLEAHHVVGDDCWIFKVAVRDVQRLEEVLATMTEVGQTTTSVVLSSPIAHRGPPLPRADAGGA